MSIWNSLGLTPGMDEDQISEQRRQQRITSQNIQSGINPGANGALPFGYTREPGNSWGDEGAPIRYQTDGGSESSGDRLVTIDGQQWYRLGGQISPQHLAQFGGSASDIKQDQRYGTLISPRMVQAIGPTTVDSLSKLAQAGIRAGMMAFGAAAAGGGLGQFSLEGAENIFGGGNIFNGGDVFGNSGGGTGGFEVSGGGPAVSGGEFSLGTEGAGSVFPGGGGTGLQNPGFLGEAGGVNPFSLGGGPGGAGLGGAASAVAMGGAAGAGNTFSSFLQNLIPSVNPSQILPSVINWLVQNNRGNSIEDATNRGITLADPLSHPEREVFQQDFLNLLRNPGGYKQTPFAQGQMNELKSAFNANVSKFGPSGTQFVKGYMEPANNIISKDFFNLANTLGNASGYLMGPGNSGTIAAQGGAAEADARARSYSGFTSIFAPQSQQTPQSPQGEKPNALSGTNFWNA